MAHQRTRPPKRSRKELLRSVIALSSQLDLPTVLHQFVQTSADLTGAKYAAINVFDTRGRSQAFIQVGVDPTGAAAMGHPPMGLGVLGQIPTTGHLRLDDLTEHPAFRGFPAGHPPMGSFLGVALRVRDKVFGDLYLADKPGGFSDSDVEVVSALASAAGVAVENAQLYSAAQRRENWLAAGQEIATLLLSGADEEDALFTIARRAREVASADAAVLVLPSVGDQLVMEIAEGMGTDDLIGTVMPPDGRSAGVLRSGVGMVVDSLYRARPLRVESLRAFGPALYAPMQTSGRGVGVMLLLRERGAPTFEQTDLATAESFAAQAALALVLAEARHSQDVAALLEERERIARDLHDLAIQQLFATGMQLETVRRRAERGVQPAELTTIISSALDNVDDTVRQIRTIVHDLRDPDANVELVERLRRETSLARTGLGFAPSLVILVNGHPLDTHGEGADALHIDEWVGADTADDVVAVVREGLANAARHARSSSVQVTVSVEEPGKFGPDGRIRIEVADDGTGLPPVQSRRSGLANLAARARRHHGTFSLSPNPEATGALLIWQVPLHPDPQPGTAARRYPG